MKRRSFLTQSSLGLLSLSALELKPFNNSISFFDGKSQELAEKILFLGDSITQAGDYINFIESQLRIAQPQASIEVLNLGLGSETISGLSEDKHPYPRPYLHDRLEDVLNYTQPDLIFACYGINCGIYHPLDARRFEAYQQGIRKLINAAKQIQAELILLTPPTYAIAIDDWIDARNDQHRNDYSYAKPYAAYDDVMRKYAEWIMSIQEVPTIDIQTPLRQFRSVCYGKDVIHPNQWGHQLMAHTIIRDYKNVNTIVLDQQWQWPAQKAASQTPSNTFTTQVPAINHIVLSDNERYNQFISAPQSFKCSIKECPAASYQLYDDNFYLGQLSEQQLKAGFHISPLSKEVQYHQISFAKKAQRLYELIAAKRQTYDYALLQHIGHQRPMSREGLPIAMAEEKKKALEEEMYNLLQQNNWIIEAIQLP
ncbi:lysophospholipase L1-like esterase [Catalinimonas alkaloidigena]|uniref:SGNH/GDSL hydrolase family protein n=1 Tax=Catalinimonas alkaloidigena TaxID=1075417 RepID=UPI0024062523|nr:SGNH/GDSL hydrolase family protein [Catalinimonas alkaloidigena]MDF9797042.1 lysophospholipase L1-like esterase [Catalinimonas alkaloidigena]